MKFIEKVLTELGNESESDRIIIDGGEIFDGTRKRFATDYFSDGTNDEIIDWCMTYEYSLTIKTHQIIK